MLVLSLDDSQLVAQETYTVVHFLFLTADDSDKCALVAFENYCWTLVLVREQFVVLNNFLATLRMVTTPEHYF